VATGFVPARIARSSLEQVPAAEAIDDLIKFRLVESLLRQPDAAATAAELAGRLGFHSVEVTAMALDELAEAGVLASTRRSGALAYLVRAEPRLRSELANLVAAGPPGLFNRLAAASVARIKRALRNRR
jgi:hypothetical protein